MKVRRTVAVTAKLKITYMHHGGMVCAGHVDP